MIIHGWKILPIFEVVMIFLLC